MIHELKDIIDVVISSYVISTVKSQVIINLKILDYSTFAYGHAYATVVGGLYDVYNFDVAIRDNVFDMVDHNET